MPPRQARALAGQDGDARLLLRGHLLDTADRLLADGDPATVTARALARAAGVSDGVLYNHFADKNDLLLTALVRRFGTLVARFAAAVPEPGEASVEDGLERLAGALLDLQSAALPLIAKLLAQPALLRRFLEAIHRADEPFGGKLIRDLTVDFIGGEQRAGRLAAGDAAAAADLLIGGVSLLALPWGTPAREDGLRDLVRTLLSGLGPQPGRGSGR